MKFDMGGMMKQAQKMRRKMEELQNSLKQRVVEGSAGGGMVRAQVNGAQEVVAIKIDPEAVDPDDVEVLEDMVLAAVNQGIKKAAEMSQQEMGKLTGGMLPPGFGV